MLLRHPCLPLRPALVTLALAMMMGHATAQDLKGETGLGLASIGDLKQARERAAKLETDIKTKDTELATTLTRLKGAEEALSKARAASFVEVFELKRQLLVEQERVTQLQRQVSGAAATSAAPAAMNAANMAAAKSPGAVVTPPVAAAGVPPDLTELTVPNCGAACPSFVLIPNPGKVTLGNGTEANNEAITADMRHRYAMGKTEVTLGQWKAFWNAPDRDYRPAKTADTHCNWNDAQYAKDDRHPVRCVNVPDAEAYARWFAKKHGAALGVRIESIGLPSEMEWELAARGGRYAQKFLWEEGASDAEKCRHAQIHACPGDVIPVGSRLKNGYNLYDMIGNTWEWTASPWQDKRSAIPSNGREAADGVSAPRVVRGASFSNGGGGWLALGDRGGFTPGHRSINIGFRLVARIAP